MNVKAAAVGSGLADGPEVSGGSRIIVDSSSGDVYALNAYGGAVDGGPVRLWVNCPKDNPDCRWYFYNGLIVAARNTALAIRPSSTNLAGSDLILDSTCTAEIPACTWAWGDQGMLQNGADRSFALKAIDGAVQLGRVVTDNTCSNGNLNCTFTIEGARVKLGADPRTGLYAGDWPASGDPLYVAGVVPCWIDDNRCSWTFRRGRIYSDYDPSLALDRRVLPDAHEVWLNGECGGSTSCNWSYDGRLIVSDQWETGMNGDIVQMALVPKGGPLTDLAYTTVQLGATGGELAAPSRCAPSYPVCSRGYSCIPLWDKDQDLCVAECSLNANMNAACMLEVGAPEPIAWSGSPAPKAKWTLLMLHYTDGAYSSESMWDQIRMGYGGSTKDVNVLVYGDTPAPPAQYTPWLPPTYRGHAVFLRVNRNAPPTILDDSLGEVDMGDPSILQRFTDVAATYFPADNYAVIGYDHGSGWPGFGSDGDAGNGTGGHGMSIPNGATDGGNYGAWGQTLAYMNAAFGKKVAVVGFDACYMGMWETASASAPYAQYMVGSEGGTGPLEYAKFMPMLAANPAMSPLELATAIVTTYRFFTMSATDLSSNYLGATGSVTSAVNALGSALRDPIYYNCVEQARVQALCYSAREGGADYCDLYAFADAISSRCNSPSLTNLAYNVKQAVHDGASHAVVAETNLSTVPGSPHGMAIMNNMPPRCTSLDPNYFEGQGSIWSREAPDWTTFLRGFAPPATERTLPAPSLTATTSADRTSATLSWSIPLAPDGLPYAGVYYAAWRGTSPGTLDVRIFPSSPNTRYTATTFTDTGLDPNQTYYYHVVAMNCTQSPGSNVVTAGGPLTPLYQINAGSSSPAWPFIADQYGSGGTMSTITNAITISGITNPAPAAVYQSERYGNSTYTLPNLTVGLQHTVRLHFAELYWTSAGQRSFNVVINGNQVLSNFDIYATAGARYKAVVREFTVLPNASGQIVINFNTVTNNASISGIEIVRTADNPPIVVTTAAQPNPVTGTTTSLSAQGLDDGAESSLTYTWAAAGIDPLPGVVTFSANGTNAAKNTTATFSALGTYPLQVTVRDPSGQVATSPVTVTVRQTITGIAVSPNAARVTTSTPQQFTAVARDQFGANMAVQPPITWTVSGGGKIDGMGLFTAGSVAGGPYTVTAKGGSISGTASVTVGAAIIYQIDSGSSSGVSPFKADQYVSGGSTRSVTNTIAISGITNPAPMAVYQSERYGTSTYTLPNLTAGRWYTVRLHFAELYWTASGKRKFNVVINGNTVLLGFDLYATAGARYKAVLREFTTSADASGRIVINFNSVTDNATISGIEVTAQ